MVKKFIYLLVCFVVCSDFELLIENCIIVNRMYVLLLIIYGCFLGFISVGSKNVIICVLG